MEEFNIVLAGVGGQGTLLAAETLGTAAVIEGFNVRVSEIHGMAQRGGAVTSQVRIGKKVLSPTIMEGCAHVLLAFEPLEALRNLRYASSDTLVILSTEQIAPTELMVQQAAYPDLKQIEAKIRNFTSHIITVETEKLATEAGSLLTRNSVLLGVLAALRKKPVTKNSILEAMRTLMPTKHVDMNVKAFNLGYKYAESVRC